MRAFFQYLVLVMVCGGSLSAGSMAVAQKVDPRAEAEAAIRKASQKYMAAIQKNDRQAMAEFWLPDGVYVDENGRSFKAQDLIAASEAAKDAAEAPSKAQISTIRFLTNDAAVEEGTSEFAEKGKSPIKGKFSAVWVRHDKQWKLDSLREFRDTPTSATSGPLAGLEPFVGQWSGKMGESNVQIVAQWNPTKTFLRRDISITTDGKTSVSAWQQVGWDPIRNQLRSWSFSEDGGYGQGWWSLEGTLWMVSVQGVHPDGRVTKATHVFKFKDRDTILWKSLDGTIDNRPQADMEVTLTREGKTPTTAASVPAKASPPAAAPKSATVAAGTPTSKAPTAKTSPSKAAPTAKATPKPTGNTNVKAAPKKPAAAVATSEAERKAALLNSEAWRRVEDEYKEWAAMQIVYTPEQMKQNKDKLRAEISKMSADELKKFIGDLDGKLQTLLSKNAMEARAWLGQYLSIYTEGYRKKFIGDVPDFADMSSGQIEQEYLKLKAKAMAQQRQQAAFDSTRTQLANQAVEKNNAAAAAASRAAMASDNAGYQNTTFQSQYHPPSDMHKLAPQQQFWVGPLGGISYALPGGSF